jgi:predicted Ser/Thr protein kinase
MPQAAAQRAAYGATAQVPVYPQLAAPGYPAPYPVPPPPPGYPAPPGGYVATDTAPVARPTTGERAAYGAATTWHAPPPQAPPQQYVNPYAAQQAAGRRPSPYRPGQAFARGGSPAGPDPAVWPTAEQAAHVQAPYAVPQAQLAPPPAPVAPPPAAGLAIQPLHSPPALPNTFTRTAERAAADMTKLPDWAKTGFRKVNPNDIEVPAAPDPRLRQEAMAEPTGAVPGYDIKERIGKGTVGVVYRATELTTGRVVALKVLLPIFRKNQTLVERFRREAKLAASLDHPNIRKIYNGGEIGGQLFLAMEYIDGETLQDKIDRHSVLPEADALRWIAQIARAMDHYVKIEMLHRDVKPANILVTKDNRALLCDLGISKRMYEDYALTMQGTTLGSPWYLSPEQGMGTDDLDVRSDIYSLGVTLFHCLTGRVPFLGGNAGVIISKHAKEPVPDVRRLNAKITRGAAALIERMMAKRREDRHQTPKELLAEIAWLRSETGIASTPIVPLDPPSLDEQAAVNRAKPSFTKRILRALGLG